MFRGNAVEYYCEVDNIEKLRDFMEYAHRNGYQFKHTVDYAAGRLYYKVTINLNRFDADQLAIGALSDRMTSFHQRRNKERNAVIEDARREGYAKAVEDILPDREG